MEAAHANQKLAEGSLRKLKVQAQDLAQLVRDEVRAVLVQELHSLAEESRRAADALHAVRGAASTRVVLWSLGITTGCSLVPLGLAYWLVPTQAEIHALRAQHDELTARIALLQERGGRAELRRCGAGARLCVRVDRTAPAYGEQADYLIVRGY